MLCWFEIAQRRKVAIPRRALNSIGYPNDVKGSLRLEREALGRPVAAPEVCGEVGCPVR
jgi:hypothetical protein